MKFVTFLLLTVSLRAMAQDPNFITPADLPKTTYQIYSESGHLPVPNFPEHYGEDEALKANLGEDHCLSKVGRQLTPWVREISASERPGPFARYTFSVSATFECLAPTLSVVLPAATSEVLFKALPIAAKDSVDKSHSSKRANVLCYDSLEEVCDGTLLRGYNEYQICEIVNLDDLSATSLIDEDKEDGTSIKRGAWALTDLLPMYRDTRSDEQHPGPNCTPTIPGKLKGSERKAATISCDRVVNESASCKVEGIIRL